MQKLCTIYAETMPLPKTTITTTTTTTTPPPKPQPQLPPSDHRLVRFLFNDRRRRRFVHGFRVLRRSFLPFQRRRRRGSRRRLPRVPCPRRHRRRRTPPQKPLLHGIRRRHPHRRVGGGSFGEEADRSCGAMHVGQVGMID